MATLMEALPYKAWILGVGLDSDERDNPPSKFAAVFARAKAEGFFLTMHCDIDQVGSIDNIRAVLEEIGVDRIDHGTNIVERSEEHTSELQSLMRNSYAVFCLKKKKTNKTKTYCRKKQTT